MASLNKQYFEGSTSFTNAHNDLQAKAGNAKWLNKFSPSIAGSETYFWSFAVAFPYVGVVVQLSVNLPCT